MAGMGDNPLVGEYTKGISKGPGYFAALDQRCKREKFDPKRIVSDLEMGLIRDQKAFVERSILQSGLGRFGPKIEAISVPSKKQKRVKVVKINTPESSFAARISLLQKHFCG
jgi:hypothetical protein